MAAFDNEMKAHMFEAMEKRGMIVDRRVVTSLEIKPHKDAFLVDRSYNADTIREEFDLVMNCIGRAPTLQGMGLENIKGLEIARGNLIVGNRRGVAELTGNENVFAIGDVLKGSARNNPSADYGGKRVARMIRDLIDVSRGLPVPPKDQLSKGMVLGDGLGHASKPITDIDGVFGKYAGFDYRSMPYTIFAIPELSGTGLSEEDAVRVYGKEAIRSVTMKKAPLRNDFVNTVTGEKLQDFSYFKVISLRENDRIVGMHYLGDHGEDLMYGMHLAMEKQLTRQDLASSFIIHPSISETFIEAAIADVSGDVDNC